MRRSLPLRRGAAALVLPLALTGLVACGGDEPTGSSKAAEPQVSEGEEIPTAEFMDMLEEAFEGATTAHVTMTNDGEFGMSAEGDVDYSSTPPSMSITMSNPAMGGEIETVLVDGAMYMKAAELGGDKYIKMDLDAAAQGLGGEDLSSQMDPRKSLGKMEEAVSSVTYVGEEDVDGEDMERYSLAIDTQKMVGDLGTGAAEMPAELSYDIWFDDEGLFRRTAMDMGEKAGTMEMTLSDWGKDVEIKAPPADQVVEMPQMPSAPPTAGS